MPLSRQPRIEEVLAGRQFSTKKAVCGHRNQPAVISGSVDEDIDSFGRPSICKRVGGIPALRHAIGWGDRADPFRARFLGQPRRVSAVLLSRFIGIGPDNDFAPRERRPIRFGCDRAAARRSGCDAIWQQLVCRFGSLLLGRRYCRLDQVGQHRTIADQLRIAQHAVCKRNIHQLHLAVDGG